MAQLPARVGCGPWLLNAAAAGVLIGFARSAAGAGAGLAAGAMASIAVPGRGQGRTDARELAALVWSEGIKRQLRSRGYLK